MLAVAEVADTGCAAAVPDPLDVPLTAGDGPDVFAVTLNVRGVMALISFGEMQPDWISPAQI